MTTFVSPHTCSDCGAEYEWHGDSCQIRFDELLSLDHSQREPWGSRHVLAFAVFCLQHPSREPQSVNNAFAILYRSCVVGSPREVIVAELRQNRGAVPTEWTIPARPMQPLSAPSITIKDLGDFPAETYAAQLDAWCRATLVSWGVTSTSPQ